MKPAPSKRALPVCADQVEALATCCLQPEGDAAQLLRSWARAGADWEDIYLHGVVPAAQLLGLWWSADRMHFADVTVASTRLQQALWDLSPTFLEHARSANNGLSALLFATPGSQHTMGVFLLGEFFRKGGWQVSGLLLSGQAEARRSVEREWFDVVGLSVSTPRCVDTLGSLIAGMRRASANPDLKIMVGGPMVALNRGLLLSLGADLIGGDARESQRLALLYVNNDPRTHADSLVGDRTIDTVNRTPALTRVEQAAAPQRSRFHTGNSP